MPSWTKRLQLFCEWLALSWFKSTLEMALSLSMSYYKWWRSMLLASFSSTKLMLLVQNGNCQYQPFVLLHILISLGVAKIWINVWWWMWNPETMLELLNQLDGFDTRGDVKVIMATNRIKLLDPALIWPGRIDRKIEFPLPDIKTKRHIFRLVLLSDLSILQLPEYLVAYTPHVWVLGKT